MKHYSFSKESVFSFHKVFFSTYFSKLYFVNYLYFKLSGSVIPFFGEDMLGKMQFYFDPVNNDFRWESEAEIARDSDGYYEKHKAVFYPRDGARHSHPKVILDPQRRLLESIKAVFAANGTNYRIIVNPLYDQKKLHPEDFKALQDVFGAASVYDFSGVNSFTNSRLSFYESSHFRPHVGTEILKQVYREKSF